jgi:hypothetical protein
MTILTLPFDRGKTDLNPAFDRRYAMPTAALRSVR